ncbi:MAG: hypothetical protein ACLFU1_08775 [Alphaproteobacteria bacterium]
MIPQDKIDDIANELEKASNEDHLLEVKTEIETSLQNAPLNDIQIQALRDQATPTLLIELEKALDPSQEEQLSNVITRAFVDPVRKTGQLIKGYADIGVFAPLPQILDQGILCLKDIANNARLLFDLEDTTAIKEMVERYEAAISKMHPLYKKLNTHLGTPYTPDPSKDYADGRDHLRQLPENFATLTQDSIAYAPEP